MLPGEILNWEISTAKWLVVWGLAPPHKRGRSRTQILGSSFRVEGGLQDQAPLFLIWTSQIWTHQAWALKGLSLPICKVGIVAAHVSKIWLGS